MINIWLIYAEYMVNIWLIMEFEGVSIVMGVPTNGWFSSWKIPI